MMNIIQSCITVILKNIAGSVLIGKREGYVPAGVRVVFVDMFWNEGEDIEPS
jgi:hypothetical protein